MHTKKTGIQSFLLTPRLVRENIQKQAHLDTLSIFDCEGAGLGEIILLISILKKSHKHLRHLKITIKESMAATEKEFKKLFFELAKLTELEHLDLNLIGCKKITDMTVFHLCLQLGNFKQLKTLSLTFSSYYITNKSIVQISKLIAKLKALQNLSLKFIKCFELTKVGANYLLYKLKRAKTLQSLTLAFRECNQIKDVVVDSLANLLPYLKSLVHFHCFFICCGKIVNQTVSKLATQLDHKKTLKTLSFWFVLNESIIEEIKDLTLKKLFSSISRLPHLEEISLNVSVHEETLKYIWDPLYLPLEKLKNLKKLSLHFPNNHRITITELLKSLNSVVNPQQLQKLILDLSSRPITDEDCISIFHTLKRFQRLQAFKIDLSKCQNITDKGFLSMLESIENVKDVNSLSLSFGRCHQLTDDSICSLPKFLSRYPSLKNIEADFSRCLNIADESIFQLDSLLANQM